MKKPRMTLTPAEADLVRALRTVGWRLAAEYGTNEGTSTRERFHRYTDDIAGTVTTCILDATGDRPGSWEADVGKRMLPLDVQMGDIL